MSLAPMSLESLLDELRGQRPPTPFAPAELVRRRGRQRNHRQALTAGAAVLVVAGAGVGVLSQVIGSAGPPVAGSTSAPPSAPLSSPPSAPLSSPSGGLLTPADLGPGDWRQATPEIFEGQDLWYWADACTGYESGTALGHQASVATVLFQHPGDDVLEILERYEPGWGTRSLADIRVILARCATVSPEPGVAPLHQTVVATGFAGAESMLVKTEAYYFEGETIAPEPQVFYVAVVRVGDQVATVRSARGGEQFARTLAIRAAARLG